MNAFNKSQNIKLLNLNGHLLEVMNVKLTDFTSNFVKSKIKAGNYL